MARLKLAACAAAQAVWVPLRSLGRRLLGAPRWDGLVARSGLRAFKGRHWLQRRVLPDGNVVLHRPSDACLIDEVYAENAYRAELIEAGQTVVDVGAHIGTFALRAARRVGPTGRVVACEPSPATLELLRRNVSENRLAWVSIQPVAAAEAEGSAELGVAREGEDNPAADTLLPASGRRRVPVRLRRLDDILAEAGVSTVNLLKIDAEGAELRVLEGAPRTLARTRRVVMEIHPPGVDPDRVVRLLEAAGFSCRLSTGPGGTVLLEAERGERGPSVPSGD